MKNLQCKDKKKWMEVKRRKAGPDLWQQLTLLSLFFFFWYCLLFFLYCSSIRISCLITHNTLRDHPAEQYFQGLEYTNILQLQKEVLVQ
jgi:hypothetical protein